MFAKLKMTLKSRYQEIVKWRKQVKETKATIQELESQKEQLLTESHKIFNCNALFALKSELSTQYARLRELEVLVAGIEENIRGLERCMFDMVYLGDTYLSTHQKIQLLGGGVYKAKEIIEGCLEFGRCPSSEDITFIDLVMHHTEYQWNKQRSRDWIDCKNWEIPVFTACRKELLRRMKKHEEETGRNFMMEFLERRAKESGQKLVPLQTEHGVVMMFEGDIESKYERHGKVMKLKGGSSVVVYKR